MGNTDGWPRLRLNQKVNSSLKPHPEGETIARTCSKLGVDRAAARGPTPICWGLTDGRTGLRSNDEGRRRRDGSSLVRICCLNSGRLQHASPLPRSLHMEEIDGKRGLHEFVLCNRHNTTRCSSWRLRISSLPTARRVP